MAMTLTQLTYIVAVDKFKNFGLAAESCKITQPTLSMQIQKLEEQLGIIFFDRSQQPIKTTKIGETLITQARVILNESQRFQEIINDDKGVAKGEIEVGVIPTLAPYLLPLFIRKFSEKHPHLQIKIHELQTHEIIEKIKNNTLDMALLVTPIDDEKIITHPLFYEPFLLYTSDKNLISQKTKVQQSDLNSADLWLLTEGHCFRDQTLAICKNRKKITDERKNVKFESGSLETLRRMVDEENGFTLLPFLAATDLMGAKKLKEFSSPVPTREVSLVHSAYFKRENIKNSLIEVIQKSLPKEISSTITKNVQVIDLPMGKR
jgi:LysR family transcriptional regulator, hydrogen peroxide-inducible genes activator